jgi:hypothetical protein
MKNGTKVNDKEVKNEDHKKYKELYKKHFDKEIDGTIKNKQRLMYKKVISSPPGPTKKFVGFL